MSSPKPSADPFVLTSGSDGILSATSVAALPAIGTAPLVRLIDAGTEPRAELRYAAIGSAKASIDMTLDLQLALRVADKAMPPTPLPPMLMHFDVDISARPNDTTRVSSTLRSSKSKGRDAAERKVGVAIDPKLAKLVGVTTNYALDNRGFVHEATVIVPPDAPAEMAETIDQMRQSLTSLAVPMPAEPVGVGARWQVLKRITAGGVDTAQLGTYTLVSRVGDDIELAVEAIQFAAAREVQIKVATARLERYQARGGGTVRTRMSEPLTTSGSMDVVSDVAMRVVADGQEAAVSVHATVTVVTTGKTTTRARSKQSLEKNQ